MSIDIFGLIEEGFSERVLPQIYNHAGDEIVVKINSKGGDVFEGLAIFNALVASDKKISVEILGLAASIASLIAMSGDVIKIHENAFLMIHKPWSLFGGNALEITKQVEQLKNAEYAMRPAYLRGGKVSNELLDSVFTDEDVWINADSAVKFGLADMVIKSKKKTNVNVAALLPITKRNIQKLLQAKFKMLGESKVDLSELKTQLSMSDMTDEEFVALLISKFKTDETQAAVPSEEEKEEEKPDVMALTSSLVNEVNALKSQLAALKTQSDYSKKAQLISANAAKLPTQGMRDYANGLSLIALEKFLKSLPETAALVASQTSKSVAPDDENHYQMTERDKYFCKTYGINPVTYAKELAQIKGQK
jgi:ATP-dependent protease ClpP protease subunit